MLAIEIRIRISDFIIDWKEDEWQDLISYFFSFNSFQMLCTEWVIVGAEEHEQQQEV